jgi:shikimate dehydrogenase
VLALAEAGATDVGVVNRTGSRAQAAAALAGDVGRVVENDDVATVAQADLVVNATPVGMEGGPSGDEDWLIAPGLLHAGQVVADLVYVPRTTEWLAAAEGRGARIVGGLGMLVHQAAAQIELWTGQAAPVDAMWAAAASAA